MKLTRAQGLVWGKLTEQGLTLKATEDEMAKAFAGCAAPTKCLMIAKELVSMQRIAALESQLATMQQERDKLREACARLTDEAERIALAAEDEGYKLPALRRAVQAGEAALAGGEG